MCVLDQGWSILPAFELLPLDRSRHSQEEATPWPAIWIKLDICAYMFAIVFIEYQDVFSPRCKITLRNSRIMRCWIIFSIHCFTVTSHRFALLMMFVLGFARSVWINIQIFILRFFLYNIHAHYFFTDVFQCILDIIFTTITFTTVNFYNISLC